MILKELFDRVTFDQLLPYLLPRIEGHEDNIHHFRVAYDLISLYEPIQVLQRLYGLVMMGM